MKYEEITFDKFSEYKKTCKKNKIIGEKAIGDFFNILSRGYFIINDSNTIVGIFCLYKNEKDNDYYYYLECDDPILAVKAIEDSTFIYKNLGETKVKAIMEIDSNTDIILQEKSIAANRIITQGKFNNKTKILYEWGA